MAGKKCLELRHVFVPSGQSLANHRLQRAERTIRIARTGGFHHAGGDLCGQEADFAEDVAAQAQPNETDDERPAQRTRQGIEPNAGEG